MAKRLRIRIKKTGAWDKLKQLGKQLPARLAAAKRALMADQAERLKEDLRLLFIPAGEWTGKYSQAVQVVEITGLPKHIETAFAVVAEEKAEFQTLDAETTLLTFVHSPNLNLPQFRAVVPFNPWTVDAVPAVEGGYPGRAGEVVAKQATPEEVAARRQELAALLPAIGRSFADERLKFARFGIPRFGKEIILDLAFLAARLEFGFGGFRPTPHWKPAIRRAKKNAEAYAADPDKLIDLNLKGFHTTIGTILDLSVDAWERVAAQEFPTVPLEVAQMFDRFGQMIGEL